MTDRARRKLHTRMRQAFRHTQQMRKRFNRAVSNYKRLARRYRAA
jgi:hypothetical protein